MRPSRTAMLAWEAGSGLGHAHRLLTIAVALIARGWSAVVVARDLWAFTNEYRAANIPPLQAPAHRGPKHLYGRSFADSLAACGYRDIETLLPPVLAWDGLIDLVKPDVIVADLAPLLTLAAHGRIPVLAIGDGYVLPPVHLPRMPEFRSGPSDVAWEYVPAGRAQQVRHLPGVPADEDTLLANAAAVLRRRGQSVSVPRSLPSLIGGQAHVVCTYPETDFYAHLRIEPASGPLETLSPQGQSSRQALFAYLDADFAPTTKLLEVLARCRFPVEVFVRNLPDQMKCRLRARNVRVHETPPALVEVAERSSIIVHHGGVGTMEKALALGRPQLLLPKQFEQRLNASNLLRLGVAKCLPRDFSLAEASEILSEAISSESLAGAAQETAGHLAKRPSLSLERIIGLCEELKVGS